MIGNIESNSGMAHRSRELSSSLAYITEVFTDYKRYGDVSTFHGRVAEIGPGDNCGVAMMFLREGCVSVDLVDRFYTKRNVCRHADIYRALMEQDALLKSRFRDADPNNEDSFPGIVRHYGNEASAERFFIKNTDYDFIVSRAVLEHLYNPADALASMARALSPGGMMLHKVDLSDHGMFSIFFHELKFYEVPDWLYPHMTRSSGYPNRITIDRYRNAMSVTGLECNFLVTRLAGAGAINPHVPYCEIPLSLRQQSLDYIKRVKRYFSRSMSDVGDEDLSISGFFLIAKKQ